MKPVISILCVLFGLSSGNAADKRALLIPVHEPVYAKQIDFIKAGLEQAVRKGMPVVFLEIDIPGGEPDYGKDVAGVISETTSVRVIAFIKDRAYASGLEIALASAEIVFRRGATLGNASYAKPDENRLSPLRARIAGLARRRGYPVRLAEAMIDPDIQVIQVKLAGQQRFFIPDEMKALTDEQRAKLEIQRTIVEKGKILTLEAADAIEMGFGNHIVPDRTGCFEKFGFKIDEVEIYTTKPAPDAPPTKPQPQIVSPSELQPGKTVAIIPLNDGKNMVDMSLAGFVRRKILEAKRAKVDAIVFEVDTWGGQVHAAELITRYIGGAEPIPTIAMIRKAVSAGALISASCDKIYMFKGGTIGSALPVNLAGKNSMTAADRKVISAISSLVKALAEKNEYPPKLFEPMVNPDLELYECHLDGELAFFYADELEEQKQLAQETKRRFEVAKRPICRKGDILNLTAEAAEKYKLSSGTLGDQDELWTALSFENPKIIRSQMSWPENVARIISSPYIAGPLMGIGFIGLIIEFITPGFGVGGTIGLMCFGLALWSQYIVGNANSWEILLFLLGFAFLAIEVIALPGFGVMGVIGIVLVFISLILAYVPDAYYYDPSFGDRPWRITVINRAVIATAFGVVGACVGVVIARRYLPLFDVFRRLAVTESVPTDVPGAPTEMGQTNLLGTEARTLSPLRPAGTAEVEGEIVDVITEGEFIEAGETVSIARIEGNKIFVTPVG